MGIESFEINGHEYSILALSFLPACEQERQRWNHDTEEWEPIGKQHLPDRYVINLPASEALTELIQYYGCFETAYDGLDYLDSCLTATGIADTKWWHELVVAHSTGRVWTYSHSLTLT